ncbi:MAG: sigma-70 family RNA polymerase sigma factor [Vicinamibacterales bacterium]
MIPDLGSAKVSDASDETELLARLRAGEDAAFEVLVRTYSPRLLIVARRIVGNDEDARDVIQDAFVSAFRNMGRFAGDSRLSTWLHRIVVNTALMKLRTRRRKPEESIEPLLPSFLTDGHHAERFTVWRERADQELSRKETQAAVRRHIDELPERFRTVLLLRDIEGLSTEETARLLNTTANAVKIRLHRARQALRTLLAPHFAQGEL